MIDREEMEWAFRRLESIGQKLKLISTMLLTITLLNLSLVLSSTGRALYLNSTFVTFLSIVSTFFVFFLALWFDSLRKDGKSYYDEISGAMHTGYANERSDYGGESIMARVAIKKFMNSYDIPLVPGKYGPGVIVALNMIVIVCWVILTSSGLV